MDEISIETFFKMARKLSRQKFHNELACVLQSNQVKRTPQESINEFIIQKLNPLLVVDFRFISAFLYV